MNRRPFLLTLLTLTFVLATFPRTNAQTITATLEGRVFDSSGAVLPKASVTVTNAATGLSRSIIAADDGGYRIALLPVGEYTASAELAGFQREAKKVTLQVGQTLTLDFKLRVGQITQEVEVQGQGALVEPTRTSVSSVISERQIESLPVNGRQFIDFALLAPGVTVGETTSGNTDVVIEPVTKLSFAGQNIHFNFIAIDGADNISTASGIQKTTPSQEAVREFQVINTQYSAEAGRAVAGIVNIVTKGGTNRWTGAVYEYFRNDALDAASILASPGLNKLRQNQYGFMLGGPLRKDRTFLFGNYEGQRRRESPFYNSIILSNLAFINALKSGFGLPTEDLNKTRSTDYDNFLVRLDHVLSAKHSIFVRYFFNDQRAANLSPLNDGFDLPSAFRDNAFRDQSLVGSLSSIIAPTFLNDLRGQYAHRSFDFPNVTTQPHLEVANQFTAGQNRGNPEFYEERRFEVVDNVTKSTGRHTISFGGNFNSVSTTESFPIFFPFEATFGCLTMAECPFSMEAGSPFVIFFSRYQAPDFDEPSFDPAIFQATRTPDAIRDQASSKVNRTYDGFFLQDKWRATDRLTLNFGLRYEFETWPDNAVKTDWNNVDPRAGFAFNIGTSRNLVLRGGAGFFHGIIPSPLFFPQGSCCGGSQKYPGREAKETDANARAGVFAFASDPFITSLALNSLLTTGTYPDAVPLGFCPGGALSGCGFFGRATVVRFARDHQAPYGIQASLSLEFSPFRDASMSVSYLHVRGLRLGSFFNVNQPDPSGQVLVHNSRGGTGLKDTYFCTLGPPACPPGTPGTRDPQFAIFFEADSRWDSVFDGLLVDFNKRPTHHIALGASYTFSKSIDNGPNPSFVLIPQNSGDPGFRQERSISSDDLKHRFVLNTTLIGPTKVNPLVNDFEVSAILSLQSKRYFTKFAGFDANGDIFGVNDRVGVEPRNTFPGDNFRGLDLRVSRSFQLQERVKLQAIAEAFNVFNTLNVHFFNTTYGAADFCNVSGPLDATCGAGPFFVEGSPNPAYGTPRAIFNPRQIQFALRLTF